MATKVDTVKLATGADLPLFGLGTWLVCFCLRVVTITLNDDCGEVGEFVAFFT